jgi:hypothetical protein
MKVMIAKHIIDNQKLLVYNVAIAMRGKDKPLPNKQISGFVHLDFFSYLSEIKPKNMPDENPKTVNMRVFM